MDFELYFSHHIEVPWGQNHFQTSNPNLQWQAAVGRNKFVFISLKIAAVKIHTKNK